MTQEIQYDRPNTVSGLVAKHKELAQLRAHHQAEISALNASIEQVSAVIRLFDPKCQEPEARQILEAKKPKRNGLKRFMLSTLRESSEPMTSRQIALLWAAECGLEDDNETINKLRGRVTQAIKDSIKQGLVECVGQTHEGGPYGPYKLWRIAQG